MLTKRLGLDLGSPERKYDRRRSLNSILSDDSHKLEVMGEGMDARGLTKEAYLAFFLREVSRKRGRLIDPSTGSIDRYVWLPGVPVEEHFSHWNDDIVRKPIYYNDALVATDCDWGDPIPNRECERRIDIHDPGSNERGYIFRPAVIVPAPEVLRSS